MTSTAFVKKGNETKSFVDNLTQKEFAQELRANGFKVIKIFPGEVGYEVLEEWQFWNRK